jgi:hypothetical protein
MARLRARHGSAVITCRQQTIRLISARRPPPPAGAAPSNPEIKELAPVIKATVA